MPFKRIIPAVDVPFDEMPDNIKSVVSVISAQYNGAIDSGWPEVKYTVTTDGVNITVKVISGEFAFVFDMGGTFIGVYNWKE